MKWLGLILLACAIGCGPPAGPQPDASVPDGGRGQDAGSADSGTPDGGMDGGLDGGLGLSCTGASPSFSTQVHPLIQSCGGELCHGGLAQGAWPYDSLVNVPASRDTCDPSLILVTPGQIDQSYFLNKLTGIGMCPNTARMPMTGTPLTPAQIQTITDWICQGAQNN